jgi:hypothetical protein
MKTEFKNFIIGFLHTFTNNRKGNSARKTTAFALMVCVGWVHYGYLSIETATTILLIDLSFVCLLLGIVTAQNLLELKFGKKTDENNIEKE